MGAGGPTQLGGGGIARPAVSTRPKGFAEEGKFPPGPGGWAADRLSPALFAKGLADPVPANRPGTMAQVPVTTFPLHPSQRGLSFALPGPRVCGGSLRLRKEKLTRNLTPQPRNALGLTSVARQR